MQPDAAAPAKRVNLTELALIIGKSTNTLRDVIHQHPDLVLSRGSNGVAYEFDADACAE
jgi:hypothetical protein